MDAGYGADDPALLLVHWKFYLRSVTNAMIDARIHCDAMTEDEAVALMVDGGFQEEAEARNKYRRARLSSTQLSTYFAGSLEMWDIELEARRRAASAAGADPSAIRARPAARRSRRHARLPLPRRTSRRSSVTALRRRRSCGGCCSSEVELHHEDRRRVRAGALSADDSASTR